MARRNEVTLPKPSKEQVEIYLNKWDALENYMMQEGALDKLFFGLCKGNSDISDILIKVATLNDFYSTNIFSVFPVAKHILSLDIDERLEVGDESIVDDIQHVVINGMDKYLWQLGKGYFPKNY